MSSLRKLGRQLPDSIVDPAVNLIIAGNQFRGENVHVEHWNDYKFRFGYWDRRTFGAASRFIRDGEIGHEGIPLEYLEMPESVDGCLDIGAHFGAYAVPLGVMNKSIPIHAFEPEPYNLRILNLNLARNRLKSDRVSTHRVVVSDYSGTTTFYRNVSSTGPVAGTMHPVDNDAEYEGTEYEVVSAAGFCVDHGISNPWVKIDAEGDELSILKSLLSADKLESVSGLVELHLNRDHVSRERFREITKDNGLETLEVKRRNQDTNPAFLFATKNADYW